MNKNMLFYLISVIGLEIAYMFFNEKLLLIILFLLLSVPVISLTISLPFMILCKRDTITLYGNKTVNEGSSISLSAFSDKVKFIPRMVIRYEIINTVNTECTEGKFYIAGNINWGIIKNVLSSAKCGCYRIIVKECKVYDLTGLFSLNVKTENSVDVAVIPFEKKPENYKIINQKSYFDVNNRTDFDNYTFTDYTGGSVKNVNWKLSAKKDKLIEINYKDKAVYNNMIRFVFSDNIDENISLISKFVYISKRMLDAYPKCIVVVNQKTFLINTIKEIEFAIRYIYSELFSFDSESGKSGQLLICNSMGEEVEIIE